MSGPSAAAFAAPIEGAAPPGPSPPPRCDGAYADEFTALKAEARDFDHRPEAVFSRCTRNTAVYECLSYASDGTIRRKQKRAVAHGTAFGYKRQGADTLLLTNEHVAVWPAVTDAQHAVDGVPSGCRKVSEILALVDDEHDSYPLDDVLLTRVVADPQLDVAVLRAHAELPVMPWKIGHSGALTERNIVEVRGFPLGAFRATNVGKVISPHDRDEYGEWEHDDFVVDALLSPGNSGSPVLAVSCVTGEYELVGIYHAGYTEGSALNVVIGIDQVRDLMTTLKRGPRAHPDDVVAADGAARETISSSFGALDEMFFPFGAQVAQVRRARAGALVFAIYPKDFPASSEPLLVVEDRPVADSGASFGQLGSVWLGSARGLKRYEGAMLDGDALIQVTRTLDALRSDAAANAVYRVAGGRASSRQAADQRARSAKTLARLAASRSDQVQTIVDLAERLGPSPDEAGTTLAVLLTTEVSTPPPAASRSLSPSPPPLESAEGTPRAIALSDVHPTGTGGGHVEVPKPVSTAASSPWTK
jgi:trypsin-like peptidase